MSASRSTNTLPAATPPGPGKPSEGAPSRAKARAQAARFLVILLALDAVSILGVWLFLPSAMTRVGSLFVLALQVIISLSGLAFMTAFMRMLLG